MKDCHNGSLGRDIHRPSFRFSLILVTMIAIMFVISACSSGTLTQNDVRAEGYYTEITKKQVDDQFANIERVLTCEQSYNFYDDIYSFPYMRGVTCLASIDTYVHLRVFTSGEAMIQNLDSAIGLSQPGQLVLLGENWLAIAPESIIENLQRLDSETSILSRHETMSFLEQNSDVKPNGYSANFCVGWASSVIAEILLDDSRTEFDRQETERLYPGLLEIIDNIVANTPGLQRSIEKEFLIFKSVLSKEMTPIKEHCLSAVRNGPQSMMPSEP